MQRLAAVIALGFLATAAHGAALPAVQYNGTVAGDEIYTRLKNDPMFANLSKDLVGCPIVLRVTHSFVITGGGKATALGSVVWSIGTLGILPAVTNNDLVITYEVLVNGTVLKSFVYQRNFTRAINLWANDTTYGLGKDGLAWAKETATQFATEAAKDPKLADLVAEYQFYFGPAPK